MDRTNPENLFDLEIDLYGRQESSWDRLLTAVSRMHGTATTAEVLDRIKAQGFKYSTKGAITVAVCDAVIPPQKKELLEEADAADRTRSPNSSAEV